MSNLKKVLYIGSGNCALLAKNKNLSDYIVVCVNNAWRIFDNSKTFDYWIHSGDFPIELRPTTKNFKFEISYKDYVISSENIVKKLNIETKSPQHYIGYTIFFSGLYWIFDRILPDEIYLLGFNHNYNKDKADKWLKTGMPNPQNNYLKSSDKSIKQWSDEFFKDYDYDFFYGHGTPDPLRLGYNYLIDKFNLAKINANKLGIKIYNASNLESEVIKTDMIKIF